MGYFPNGTAGEMYEAKWCSRCVHHLGGEHESCPIMVLHFLWNYDACNGNEEDATDLAKARHLALGVFIEQKGAGNEECTMFHEGTADERAVASGSAAPFKRVYESEDQFRKRVNEREVG